MEPYYYMQMDKQQQAAYRDMKAGLQALAPSFLVTRLENRVLGDIFFQLRLDCPEIFYAVGFQYRFYPDSTKVELVPEYLFEKEKIREHQKAMEARIAKLIRPAQALTAWEKELYIHDFICQGVRYDKLKKPYSHEIIGPLGQGVGVCEGIAKTVKILCDALGIWCMIVISEANPEKNIKYRHAWNIIRAEGKYCHLDATFDNSLGTGDNIRYDYFNLLDSAFFRDHEPVLYKAPPCSEGNLFYYLVKKQSFSKTEDVEKRALQAIKKKKNLTFHWRGGYLTREKLTELLQLLEGTAHSRGKYAQVSLNWPQAVLSVRFLDELPENELVLEEVKDT